MLADHHAWQSIEKIAVPPLEEGIVDNDEYSDRLEVMAVEELNESLRALRAASEVLRKAGFAKNDAIYICMLGQNMTQLAVTDGEMHQYVQTQIQSHLVLPAW